MTTKDVEGILAEALCAVLSTFSHIDLIFPDQHTSDKATKALFDFFGKDKLVLQLHYKTLSAEVTIYDTDTGHSVVTNVALCEGETTDWFDGKDFSSVERVMLSTGYNKSSTGYNKSRTTWQNSYFPGLDEAGIRNISKFICKRIEESL